MINQFVAENTQANLNFNIELQKDKRVYCFIGENGVGKTQLLESMAKSFLYCHSLLNNKENYHKSLYVKDGISEKLNGKKLYLPLGIKINENIVKNKDIDKVENAFNYIDSNRIDSNGEVQVITFYE